MYNAGHVLPGMAAVDAGRGRVGRTGGRGVGRLPGRGGAEANAGPPYYTDGQLAAEPSGLTGVAISHESLTIDMRRLPVYPRRCEGRNDSLADP